MTPPNTPITPEIREWIAFTSWFKTRQGFMITYADTLASIWHSRRQKKGLMTLAYEATEKLYEEIYQQGRKYPDVENFRVAWSRHRKNPGAKD